MDGMQNFLKKFGESILALIKVIWLSRFRTEIKALETDRDLIVLGNGPSLSESIENGAEFLKNKDLVCVNWFPLSSLFERLKPTTYITAAPELWINNLDGEYVKKRDALFKEIGKKTNWPLRFYIPFSARKSGSWKSLISGNSNIEIIYFNETGVEGFKCLKFWFFKKNLAMPRPHNVLIPAIFNGINLGYRNIYLWGAENNQFLEMSVDDNNNALMSHKHFYDSATAKPRIMKKKGHGKRHVHEILHKFMLSFEGYHILKEYARSRGVKVINKTPASMIDAFDREA